jgi:hypothetical protein
LPLPALLPLSGLPDLLPLLLLLLPCLQHLKLSCRDQVILSSTNQSVTIESSGHLLDVTHLDERLTPLLPTSKAAICTINYQRCSTGGRYLYSSAWQVLAAASSAAATWAACSAVAAAAALLLAAYQLSGRHSCCEATRLLKGCLRCLALQTFDIHNVQCE